MRRGAPQRNLGGRLDRTGRANGWYQIPTVFPSFGPRTNAPTWGVLGGVTCGCRERYRWWLKLVEAPDEESTATTRASFTEVVADMSAHVRILGRRGCVGEPLPVLLGYTVVAAPLAARVVARGTESPRTVAARADGLGVAHGRSGFWQSTAAVSRHSRRLAPCRSETAIDSCPNAVSCAL